MKPIQWHLKANWHVPESLENQIPVHKSLQKHLCWCLQEEDVLAGQPLHPLRHAQQIFTDAFIVVWGTHLGDFTARIEGLNGYAIFSTVLGSGGPDTPLPSQLS